MFTLERLVDPLVISLVTLVISSVTLVISSVTLIISGLMFLEKKGTKLTQSYEAGPTDRPTPNKATILPITNHKDRSIRINALFIRISNIHLKLPIPPFTIEPYNTHIAQFNLHEIYGFTPNIESSYMDDCCYLAPPTIQVMSDIIGKQYASTEINNLMTKIKSGKFSLEANTELKRVKIKYKAIKINKNQILSIITLNEATNICNEIRDIDETKTKLSTIINAFSNNSYLLSEDNGRYMMNKKPPSK